jgi:hypothetical protein
MLKGGGFNHRMGNEYQAEPFISDLTGVSGLAIVDAIVAGERDLRKLANQDNKQQRKTENRVSRQALALGYQLVPFQVAQA